MCYRGIDECIVPCLKFWSYVYTTCKCNLLSVDGEYLYKITLLFGIGYLFIFIVCYAPVSIGTPDCVLL